MRGSYFHIIILAIITIGFVSCTNQSVDGEMGRSYHGDDYITFNAMVGLSDSRTTIQSDGSVVWSAEESINVFCQGNAGKFVSNNSSTSSIAYFSGSLVMDTNVVWALYPYQSDATFSSDRITLTVPHVQYANQGTFSSASFPCIATTETSSFIFKNVCGGVKIQLSGNDIHKIVFIPGQPSSAVTGRVSVGFDDGAPAVKSVESCMDTVTFLMDDDSCFKSGVPYYLTLLPCTYNKGFEIDFYSKDKTTKYTYDSPVTINRSSFLRLIDLDKEQGLTPSECENLSSPGTANSYIVNKTGNYCFIGTVKGGGDETVGVPASAEVLWESFGTDVAPSVGDIVKNVSYSEGYVTFSTASALTNGNAVIAVKDVSGTILWSWHIWVCKDFDPKATTQTYAHNSGILMDRNLGATSATPGDARALGLLYQWGRKDPFLASSSITSNNEAKSTISWPAKVSSTLSNGTIEYATAHPTTFIKYNASNYDWFYTGSTSTDNTRWQTMKDAKGIYDPCPYGWRVPEGGPDGVWSVAFGTNSNWTISAKRDTTLYGVDFGSVDKPLNNGVVWYPAAGCRSYSSGSIVYTGSRGYQWSCSISGRYAYYSYFHNNGKVYPSSNTPYRAYAKSIRCISESSPAIIPVSGVKIGSETIHIQKGSSHTKQLSATVTPGNANNTDITWISTNNSIATVSATGVVEGISDGTCVIIAQSYNGIKDSCNLVVESQVSDIINLSSTGKANCYIVNKSGSYKFNATVKGCSTEPVGNPVSAEVLWESFGSSVSPAVGDIVADLKYQSGYVLFSTPESMNDGNAVIAVKDASGNILWSWHIWACKDYIPELSAHIYNNNAGTMMDRNLGATSATPGNILSFGLLYQWGRKDPFLGASSNANGTTTEASSTLSWPQAVAAGSTTGTVAYSVAHPTTFIKVGSNWVYSSETKSDSLWMENEKTIYDPCPYGWRVPKGGVDGLFCTALDTSSSYSVVYDSTNKGRNFGMSGSSRKMGANPVIWYPASGWRYCDTGALTNVATWTRVWTATMLSSYSEGFYFSSSTVYPMGGFSRADGLSVRCIKEGENTVEQISEEDWIK